MPRWLRIVPQVLVVSEHHDPRWNTFDPGVFAADAQAAGQNSTSTVSQKKVNVERGSPWFPQPPCRSPQFFSPSSQTPGLAPLLSVFPRDHRVLQSYSHLPRRVWGGPGARGVPTVSDRGSMRVEDPVRPTSESNTESATHPGESLGKRPGQSCPL